MKAYPLIGIVAALAIVPAIFADTTGTGSTTSTGSTSTGTVTSTGTTSTGNTNTGTSLSGSTSTGTTNTGAVISTGSTCLSASGVKIDRINAQQAYLSGMVQLLSNKKTAYQAALTLSGSGKITAIKAANEAFRIGVKDLQKTLKAAKRNIRDDVMCGKIEDSHNDEDSDDDKKSEKEDSKMAKKIEKSVKKIEKEIRKISKKTR